MSSPADFDRTLAAWLDELAPMREPEGLTYAVLARTRRTRRIPGWATFERWLPMQTTYKFGAVPRTALILVTLALLTALLGIAIALGASAKLPPPVGPAVNGLIAFDDDGDIWVVKPDGTDRTPLTTGPTWDTNPVWSQDGTRIAYWSQPTRDDAIANTDGSWALHVMNADGSKDKMLVEGLTLSRWSTLPAWSHDGHALSYSDHVTKGLVGYNRVNIVPVDGGNPVELVSPGQDPTWSHDDTLIAYQSGGGGADGKASPQGLSVIGSDGTGPRLIDGSYTDNPYAYSFPQWSADDKQVAYHAGPGGSSQIFVAPVDGSGRTAIAQPHPGEVWPVWSPDGKRIAYDGPSSTPAMWQIALVDPDGSNPVTLDHPPLGCNCGVRWSPDGTIVTAYKDGPVGHEDTGGSMLLVDASGKAPVVVIPYTGLSNQQVSWQRLAP